MKEVTYELVRSWIPKRQAETHKSSYGRVRILAGSIGYTGAPYFAAQGAVRAGSGLVFLHVPANIWQVLAVKCNEAMVFPVEWTDEKLLANHLGDSDAALIGPGLGQERQTTDTVLHLVQTLEMPLVLDADGINAVAGHIHILKARQGRLTVLTPHEGEFIRLQGGKPIADRKQAALAFAREFGCVMVLKGHRSLTACPDGSLYVNATGNPGMAKGGSGDILAGMILALLGQGIPPEQAVPAAVWLHGRAGDLAAQRLGEYGMVPTDLLEHIPLAFQFD